MANPYLPNWEYIPDGEPRVFGDRIYVYGSHDRKDSIDFCDYKLKVWSAPVSDPTKWVCHGDIFRSRDGHDSPSDVDWTDELLFAPDVVERGGKYYLYAYIVNAKGCVAVADRPEGPFRLLSRYEYDIPNHYDNGTFIDPGVLVDDDGRVYLVYGGGQIWCVELEKDLSAVKPGTKRKLIDDAGLVKGCLAEGSHVYKMNGYYYIFIITWPPHRRRTQLCYRSETLDGEWEMKVIIDDNIGFRNDGVAQGGIVDDKDGNWYCFVFQDHGAVGRAPVLSTMTWEDGWPVVGVDGKVPRTAKIPVAGHEKKGIVTSDEFINSQIVRPYHNFADTPEEANDYNGSNLALEWQWNHNPDNRLWSLTEREGYLRLRTVNVCDTVADARNTISQRTFGPECGGYIKLDVSEMKDGDTAGLAAFAEKYGYVAVKIEDGKKYIVTVWYDDNDDVEQEFETERVEITENEVYLRVDCDYKNAADKAYFYYSLDGENWTEIGKTLQMNYYGLHFMGYRYAIFNFPTKQSGGYVDVDYFRVENKLLK